MLIALFAATIFYHVLDLSIWPETQPVRHARRCH